MRVVSAGAQIRTGNALVRVRRLLDNDLLVGALARAAAHGNEPEEAGGQRKGDADPERAQHLGAHRGLDVVRLEHGFEDGDERGVECG